MKKLFAPNERQAAISRRWRAGGVSLLLIVAFAAMAQAKIVSRISASVEEARSVAAWYWQSGQWRADVSTYVTDAEYLFCPQTGAGAGVRVETDD
jgi:hypothetical protein